MKKTPLKRLVPFIPLVSRRASANANTLTVSTDTSVNSDVKPSEYRKSVSSVNALI